MKKLLVLAILCSGCAVISPRDTYMPYIGAQQAWKTSPGSLMTEHDGIQIYRGFPARPYIVIGQSVCAGGRDRTLAIVARRHLADAVIVLRHDKVNSGYITSPGDSQIFPNGMVINYSGSVTPINHYFTTVALIRFTPDSVQTSAPPQTP